MNKNRNKSEFQLSAITSAIALTLTFSFSGVALANTTDPHLDTETIQVLGQSYRNTATKTSLEPEETPQGVTVIDGEVLEQRGVKSLNQALRYAPGVVTETKGGAVTMYDTFAIRGFGVQQSYYDGLILQYLNGWNLQPQIDPIALQQVEIFKGPSSVLYGSMPPGGMVNMIAKTPQQEAATNLGLAAGSRNLIEASIDTTGQFGDSGLNYRLVALARKQDGQVDNTEEERYVIAPSVDWQVNDKTLINFNLYYQNDPAMGMNSSLPSSGMITSNTNGTTSASTFAGDNNWSAFEREFLMLGYKINHDLSDNWSFLQNVRYTDADLMQENTYHIASNFDESTGVLGRNIYSTEEESTGFVIDNQLSGYVYTGDIEHNLLFGLDYQKLDGESSYKEYSTSNASFYAFNIFSPNNDMLDRNSLTESYNAKDDISVEQLGVYFQNQMRWEKAVLIAGGRYDSYESNSKYVDDYSTSDTKADHEQFSYRLGALYEFDNGVAPFASYATSFEPATGVNADGEAYKPEVGEQIEVGLKYQSDDQTKNASVSIFHIVKSDALMANPDDLWGPELQLGEVTSQGLEVQAQFLLNDSWDVNASYTYIDMEITQDSEGGLEGTTPIYVPEHSANLWSTYQFYQGVLAGTRVGTGVRYVGEMQMDAANTDKVPSYTLVDLSVGYDLKGVSESFNGASVNLVANNLFNTEYYTCYDSANCWYGAEQTVELNFNFQY
ncbi:TonB-dependent siderophore receptor [Vibrio algarum]|uniref:TonB-dependent siderophore receptor n=1 Tax=Vibrio algarum TaxID=3020714 RepID=A0ABT4YVU4_9VIBR|nr:TonB-dependent siderophore receptor [Vibrio sp. KJ40-1]MDB1125704.1 TonB-dependent siderophore receptor [Vibrio sp. KJ40-1]